MSAFFARRKWLILAIAGLIACVAGFEVWSRWLTVEPLDVPIALSPAGRVDRDVQIRRDCPHSVELLISSGTRPPKEAEDLIRGLRVPGRVGSRPEDKSVRIPVEWSLVDPAGQAVSSGEQETAGTFAWGGQGYYRSVVRGLRLAHGRYHLSAAILRDVPEMDGMSARLLLGCHNGKVSSGWQHNLLFFGSLVKTFFVLPLTAVLAAILLGLETSHLPRSRPRDRSA